MHLVPCISLIQGLQAYSMQKTINNQGKGNNYHACINMNICNTMILWTWMTVMKLIPLSLKILCDDETSTNY